MISIYFCKNVAYSLSQTKIKKYEIFGQVSKDTKRIKLSISYSNEGHSYLAYLQMCIIHLGRISYLYY